MLENNIILYLILYFSTILYFVVLGSYMIFRQDSPLITRGELKAKRKMDVSVGIYILLWAFYCLVYLPVMIHNGYEYLSRSYELCYLLTLMINTPAVFMVMNAIVQKKQLNPYKVGVWAIPYFLLIIWYVVAILYQPDRLPVHIATVIAVGSMAFLLLRYAKEYRLYIKRVKSEYSEITSRDIFWAWSCFIGFAFQTFMYILYEYNWSPLLEYIYMAYSVLITTYLCYCTCRQRTIDTDVVEEIESDEEGDEESVIKEKEQDKAFYSVIEQKLVSLCEGKYLFLDPTLTKETLCLRLSVNRTYLGMYLRSRGLTYYQYINSLRIDYAIKLMNDNPQMAISEVSELSGFRSQTTFRKVFQELMGCLP